MSETETVEVIVPPGFFGASSTDSLIDTAIRKIAISACADPKREFAEKYGTKFENDIFMMHPYCWCEREECQWCNGDMPNFHYKPLDFKVTWYKYIGRSTKLNKELTAEQLVEIQQRCLESLVNKPDERG
jgi:hypothetical protein